MRRRRRQLQNSLELFLDIICNTFGGVLFLAILVTILLRTTSAFHNPDQVLAEQTHDFEDVQDLAMREQHARLQLEELRRVLDRQSGVVSHFEDPKMNDLLEERIRLQEKKQALLDEREALKVAVEDATDLTRQLAEEERTLADDLARAQREERQATIQLRAETSKKTQKVELPTLKTTHKSEIGLVVRFGRLYVWHRYDDYDRRVGLNTDEFVVTSRGSEEIETVPKPYAGTPITETNATAIRLRLSTFSVEDNYLTTGVWPDSFATFQVLKREMVAMGFNYRLIPMTDGGSLTDGGSDEIPLVQ